MKYVHDEDTVDHAFKPWKQQLELARSGVGALYNVDKPKGFKGKLQPLGASVSMMKKGRRALPRFLPRHGRLMVR